MSQTSSPEKASPTDPLTLMAMYGSAQDFDPNAGTGFEGPEKRLEIIVKPTDEAGLRKVPQVRWEEVVGTLNAKIVSRISNEHIDSYVLTESSLFVTANRIVLITCGTTTLLLSLPMILSIAKEYNCSVEWASFMRKNYSYPWEQKGPHASMGGEYSTLSEHFPGGRCFVFGPVDSDHYFLFVFDQIKRPCVENDTQVSMTMYGLNSDFSKCFFADKFYPTGPETEKIRKDSGLHTILDGWEVQDLQFEPCGYSVNAIKGAEYQTMHITPEDHCSFASYETNSPLENISERAQKVLSVFRPQRFTIIVLIDPESPVGIARQRREKIGVESQYFASMGYSLLNLTVNDFGPGYVAMKLNYIKDSSFPAAPVADC